MRWVFYAVECHSTVIFFIVVVESALGPVPFYLGAFDVLLTVLRRYFKSFARRRQRMKF